jgi:phosphohistidine phosphatase
MRVILVQHGEARPKEQDADRPLTEQGRRDVTALATRLSQRNLLPRTIWHSGKTRARQSAELLSAGAAPQTRDGLGPGDDPAPTARALAGLDRDVMLVGHQPFLGALAGQLLSGADDPQRQPAIGFQPGSACCLEQGEAGGWQLAWMLRPEVIAT